MKYITYSKVAVNMVTKIQDLRSIPSGQLSELVQVTLLVVKYGEIGQTLLCFIMRNIKNLICNFFHLLVKHALFLFQLRNFIPRFNV